LYDGANQVHLQTPDYLASIFPHIHEQKKREMNNKYIDCLHMVACPHQIILGYMFLLYPESVRDTIGYLATCYQRRPPKKVLYDNSCQAKKSGKLVSFSDGLLHTMRLLPLQLLQ
jgi:hypothetical protein